jgi:2-polyprenyl-3-methyl-5-hydroxy-6-metoxy-1,4-benzoquinol methylase
VTQEPGAIRVESVPCLLCGEDDAEPIAHGTDYEYDTSAIEYSFVACRRCSHVYLNPRPTLESASAIYPSNYYALSGAHRTGALSVLGRIKDVVVGRRVRTLVAALPSGGRLMEPGCGDGSLLRAIRRARPDLHLTALDLQFSATTRAELAGARIDIVETALERARFEEPFDMVVMNQLIEHLWDARGCLSSLSGCVKLGGIVSISTPNLDGYDRGLFADRAWGGYHFPRHLNLFTRASLCRFLAGFGLQPIRMVNLAAPLIWVASIHNHLKIKGSASARFFRDSNLLALAAACSIDVVATRLGAVTSNQQLVARKVR